MSAGWAGGTYADIGIKTIKNIVFFTEGEPIPFTS